jgi:hypothetical protein
MGINESTDCNEQSNNRQLDVYQITELRPDTTDTLMSLIFDLKGTSTNEQVSGWKIYLMHDMVSNQGQVKIERAVLVFNSIADIFYLGKFNLKIVNNATETSSPIITNYADEEYPYMIRAKLGRHTGKDWMITSELLQFYVIIVWKSLVLTNGSSVWSSEFNDVVFCRALLSNTKSGGSSKQTPVITDNKQVY